MQLAHESVASAPTPPTRAELLSDLRERVRESEQYGWWERGFGGALAAAVTGMLYCVVIEARLQFGFQVSGVAFFAALVLFLLLAWLARDRARQAHASSFRSVIDTVQLHLLIDQTTRDPLTGIFNRHALEEIIPAYLRQSERSSKGLALVLMDLDYFHELNNTFGHIAGDTALVKFARTLQESVRGCDLVARYGGDEFILVLTETGLHGAEIVTRRVRERLVRHDKSAGQFSVAFTAGIAEFQKGMEVAALIQQADRDLLSRKRERPNGAHARTTRS